jgi:hypothetical protein
MISELYLKALIAKYALLVAKYRIRELGVKTGEGLRSARICRNERDGKGIICFC